jgi:uncharacterized protein
MASRLISPGFIKGFAAAAGVGLSLWLLAPAQAQFWDWGGPRRIDPFRDLFAPRYAPRDRGEGPSDFSHAPAPAAKKPEATTSMVVMGDANADWLAYGLEDAFAEKPEIAIVRKFRTDSGLIRYDPRREGEWAQVAREIIAAEKPKYIVMMIGNNDHQSIREKAPPPVRPGASNPAATRSNAAPVPQPAQSTPPAPKAQDIDPEAQPPEHPSEQVPAHLTPEQSRAASYGPWEFHTEKWEIAYIKRVDATISALKSGGVPVIWVGLPSQRATKASADSSYLNEIYRSRAEKAGITYVDIWDGFVDEGGHFSPQGPDYEGQIRRLRSGDGVYFTKFGARKLAHYVEREIERHMINHAVPVALPMPDQGVQAPNAKPGAPTQRPSVGPVVPLTAANVGSDELLGGGRQGSRPSATDASVSRVLTRGEPVPAPSGRADDFSWPRTRGVSIDTSPLEAAPASPASSPAQEKSVAARRQGAETAGGNPPVQRRSRTGDPFRLPFFFPNLFR